MMMMMGWNGAELLNSLHLYQHHHHICNMCQSIFHQSINQSINHATPECLTERERGERDFSSSFV